MGESLEVLVNGRDIGKEAQAPLCEGCGEPLVYKGEVKKTIYGVEGETRLERSYYHCRNKCERSAFFPSGQEAEIEKGSLERRDVEDSDEAGTAREVV